MNPPEPPAEPRRSYLPRLVDPPTTPDDERILPRFVEVPALRERGHGPRNLAWGVATLFVALLLLAVAIFLAGAPAALSLATCLLTAAALFVLARLHVFRQRNGGFLALGVVCLLGATFPLVERVFFAVRALTAQAAQATPPTVRAAASELPVLTESFALAAPDEQSPQVRVLKDSRVLVAGKPFLIKAGDRFPLLETRAQDATFAVRDLQISLPLDVLQLRETPPKMNVAASAPSPAEPVKKEEAKAPDLAAVTLSAQHEAIHRYPALGIKDSPENELFVSTYKQLKDAGGGFFENPEWPIELAELLAKRERWARDNHAPADAPAPAPILDPPHVSDGSEPTLPLMDGIPEPPQVAQ